METTNVFNIQHFSLNDGPGIRTVIFFKGCSLNCAWCHNPESKSYLPELSFLKEQCIGCKKCVDACCKKVHFFENDNHYIDRNKCVFCGKCVDACPISALKVLGKQYTFDEIMAELAKDDVFFSNQGGVTFSGGEPFMQFGALYALLKRCKEKGYTTCIETSGYTSKENIVKAAKYTDCFLYDCKETDPENHKKYIGVDNKIILDNLSVLNKINATVILRCPIIPSVNDRKEHFENIARLANQYSCIKSIEFMPYHPLGISKSINIGKKTLFDDNRFMDKKEIETYYFEMKKITKIPIKIN